MYVSSDQEYSMFGSTVAGGSADIVAGSGTAVKRKSPNENISQFCHSELSEESLGLALTVSEKDFSGEARSRL
jgi:hypothetical protein